MNEFEVIKNALERVGANFTIFDMCKMLDDLFENAPELAMQTCFNMLANWFD